jgi:hypothetical protein
MSQPDEKKPRATDRDKTTDDKPDPNVEPPEYRIITESEDLKGDAMTFVDKPKGAQRPCPDSRQEACPGQRR